MNKRNVTIGKSYTASFHANCAECDSIIKQMAILDRKMERLRTKRQAHMHPHKPVNLEDQDRPFKKVNLHLTQEDISVPSNWSKQAAKIRNQIQRKQSFWEQ